MRGLHAVVRTAAGAAASGYPEGEAPMLLLLIAACVENELNSKDDVAFDSGDSAPVSPGHTEETDTGGHSEETAAECADLAPVDTPVPPDADCSAAGEFSGELVERWSAPMMSYVNEIGVFRSDDSDGDGDVDEADRATIWVSDGWSEMVMLDADGAERARRHGGSWRVWATTGELDPDNLGAELVSAGYVWRGAGYVGVDDPTGPSWEVPTSDTWINYPWLADLEGDGVPELLLGATVVDPVTGDPILELEGAWSEDVTPAVSADLDRDGKEEIVAADWASGRVDLYGTDGTRLASCVVDGGPAYSASYAIGSLDEDADGELVAAGDGYVAVCDADGTLLAEVDLGLEQPSLVGLAELDGDPLPEVLLAENGVIFALDGDLGTLWSWRAHTDEWVPFSVADLDGDGRHEVLVNARPSLVILDGAGAEVTRWNSLEVAAGSAWRSQPVVADLDGDGRAEILVGGYSLHVLSSPDGGWPVRGADADWPGPDHHPGDRVDGAVPGPNAWWDTLSDNVWQGLPAGPVGAVELSVAFGDVCVEGCPGDVVVELKLRNRSELSAVGDLWVGVYNQSTGALLAEVAVDTPFPAATERSLSVRVPAESLGEGLRAVIEADAAQCEEWPDEATLRDERCP